MNKKESIKKIKIYLSEAKTLSILKINHKRPAGDKVYWRSTYSPADNKTIDTIERLVHEYNIKIEDLQ